jgi:HEAT repeat protein
LAAPETSDEVVKMIIGLVTDQDKDMRTLGLQQIREEARGATATRRFAELLSRLPAEAQAGLLDALGDRGDKAARPAVLAMLKSRDEQVRSSAVRALGVLGETDDVSLLAQSLAAAGAEKTAARVSLTRLRGQDVNTAIVAVLPRVQSEVRAELLGVLASRGSVANVPTILAAAEDADARVRTAALGALRTLASPADTAAIVKLLRAARDNQEQWRAEQALLAVGSRGKEACVEPILAGLKGADPSASAALLRALGRSGGARALAAIASATRDERPVVRTEAVRLLANWPDAAAIPHLRDLAAQPEPAGQQAVAVQGLVRLASLRKGRPADVALLGEAMKLARRPEEKRMVLGVLGSLGTSEALALARPALDDPLLTEEACLAVVLIVEKMTGPARGSHRAILEKARDRSQEPQIRARAQQVLESLRSP